MGLNGMAVLSSIRSSKPSIRVTETHPKVLHWALTRAKYDYSKSAAAMDAQLSHRLGIEVSTRNDHEWDATVSALAALMGETGSWKHDLFLEQAADTGRLVFPSGPAHYWWPE